MENVAQVVKDGLCTGCGVCAGICPTKAIEMRLQDGLLLPKVADNKCTRCRVCVKCCPGHSVDLMHSSGSSSGQIQDPLLGNFLSCHIGHSTNSEIRNDSSSGGIVTQLLVYALAEGIIDGALVIGWSKDNPLEPKPLIATTVEEILSASRSKYCPVASGTALAEILSKEGKFAVVGLPCHIHGIRKAEAVFEGLKDKIVLHIGLFCGHTVNFHGTELLLEKLGVSKQIIEKIDYRGSGWPGYMSILLKDGRSLRIRYRGWNGYWNVFSPVLFTPLRCLMCPDHCNELADLSTGDAWLPEFVQKSQGESILIARTKGSVEILNQMQQNHLMSLRAVTPSKVRESQAFSLNFKKKNLPARIALLRMLGKNQPNLNPTPSSFSKLAFLAALLPYMSFRISSSRRLRRFLRYVPFPLFRVFFGPFKIIYLLTESWG